MKPLSLSEREAIRANHPNAAPGEMDEAMDEYERLLAERFTVDPDAEQPAGAPAFLATTREERLAALHAVLFSAEEEK